LTSGRSSRLADTGPDQIRADDNPKGAWMMAGKLADKVPW